MKIEVRKVPEIYGNGDGKWVDDEEWVRVISSILGKPVVVHSKNHLTKRVILTIVNVNRHDVLQLNNLRFAVRAVFT